MLCQCGRCIQFSSGDNNILTSRAKRCAMTGVNRYFVFRNYGWITIVTVGFASVSVFVHGGEERVGLIGACVAGVLGFCFFAQQQKRAETSLFHALFTQFNARYDKLNGRLAAMTGVAPRLRRTSATWWWTISV